MSAEISSTRIKILKIGVPLVTSNDAIVEEDKNQIIAGVEKLIPLILGKINDLEEIENINGVSDSAISLVKQRVAISYLSNNDIKNALLSIGRKITDPYEESSKRGDKSLRALLVTAESMKHIKNGTFTKAKAQEFGDHLVEVALSYFGDLAILENIYELFKYSGDKRSSKARVLADKLIYEGSANKISETANDI